ncbi:MAG TPA: hypothetical protein PK466_07790 [Thermotogota bacterium]|nr:hypothetical protein [Thermotogota bacterium]HPJ88516.1 hypothetical protein [Thermotogota bacterium]HPR96216.1 hypothetical protein [Thermotogota bacterium]
MLKKFFIPTKNQSIGSYYETKGELLDFLEKLVSGNLISKHYTEEDLLETVMDLVASQRTDLPKNVALSWCLALDPVMPSDARVDFMYEPTYIVVSILTSIKVNYPYIAKQIENFDEAMKKGMHFSTLRRLRGHGYEAEDGLRDAIYYLHLGGVPEFLNENKRFQYNLYCLLKNICKEKRHLLAVNQTVAGWNKDYRREYEEITRYLNCFCETTEMREGESSSSF